MLRLGWTSFNSDKSLKACYVSYASSIQGRTFLHLATGGICYVRIIPSSATAVSYPLSQSLESTSASRISNVSDLGLLLTVGSSSPVHNSSTQENFETRNVAILGEVDVTRNLGLQIANYSRNFENGSLWMNSLNEPTSGNYQLE